MIKVQILDFVTENMIVELTIPDVPGVTDLVSVEGVEYFVRDRKWIVIDGNFVCCRLFVAKT